MKTKWWRTYIILNTVPIYNAPYVLSSGGKPGNRPPMTGVSAKSTPPSCACIASPSLSLVVRALFLAPCLCWSVRWREKRERGQPVRSELHEHGGAWTTVRRGQIHRDMDMRMWGHGRLRSAGRASECSLCCKEQFGCGCLGETIKRPWLGMLEYSGKIGKQVRALCTYKHYLSTTYLSP